MARLIILGYWNYGMSNNTPHCVRTQGITDDNFTMITMVTKRPHPAANCHVKPCKKNKMRLLRTLMQCRRGNATI